MTITVTVKNEDDTDYFVDTFDNDSSVTGILIILKPGGVVTELVKHGQTVVITDNVL